MKQMQLPHTAKATRRVTFSNPTHDQLGGSSVTYQLELVQCGKRKCLRWHGPYWYAYWTAGGKTRSLYIGKKLRPAAEVATERNERRRAAATNAAVKQETENDNC